MHYGICTFFLYNCKTWSPSLQAYVNDSLSIHNKQTQHDHLIIDTAVFTKLFTNFKYIMYSNYNTYLAKSRFGLHKWRKKHNDLNYAEC